MKQEVDKLAIKLQRLEKAKGVKSGVTSHMLSVDIEKGADVQKLQRAVIELAENLQQMRAKLEELEQKVNKGDLITKANLKKELRKIERERWRKMRREFVDGFTEGVIKDMDKHIGLDDLQRKKFDQIVRSRILAFANTLWKTWNMPLDQQREEWQKFYEETDMKMKEVLYQNQIESYEKWKNKYNITRIYLPFFDYDAPFQTKKKRNP